MIHKTIQHLLDQGKKKYIITGTDISLGSRDLDHSFEWAHTEEEAWNQALAHAAGTRFTPESIELDKS